MKAPIKITSDMKLCPRCNQPVHMDDLAMINKEGYWHKDCTIRSQWDEFITEVEG